MFMKALKDTIVFVLNLEDAYIRVQYDMLMREKPGVARLDVSPYLVMSILTDLVESKVGRRIRPWTSEIEVIAPGLPKG